MQHFRSRQNLITAHFGKWNLLMLFTARVARGLGIIVTLRTIRTFWTRSQYAGSSPSVATSLPFSP